MILKCLKIENFNHKNDTFLIRKILNNILLKSKNKKMMILILKIKKLKKIKKSIID